MRYADAEADIVAELDATSPLGHPSPRAFERHQHGSKRWVIDRHWDR